MKVSLNWLRHFVEVREDLKALTNLLTMAGLEVEGVHSTGAGFEKVVVVEISTIRRHPGADRLVLVEAKTDRGILPIVCGATNIREGQRVPLALVGARLPNGVQIKKSKIRGEVSEGMLCSEIELGLGPDASGIMILPSDLPLGANLGEALQLQDIVLDVSVTPNRPDWLCILGIAREVAALTHQRVRYPQLTLSEQGAEIHARTSVTILDPDLCPRYVARMIEGVMIGPSPRWIRNRLENVGIRSISNVVDVTNYIMIETGQPLHAFDFSFLEEGRIVVRRATDGETFVTLDGVRRTLDHEMLMICDGVKPVAIAGVMGGVNSEIKDDTRTVLLESAYFEPSGNRKTALKLGLETEAAYRFGRGVDYGNARAVANRAAQLIQELAGGRVVEGVVDVYPTPIQNKPVRLSVRKANEILGTQLPAPQVKTYLEALELDVRQEEEEFFTVTPPSFRSDLEREIDLIEEIARLDGYEKIPVTLPKGEPALSEKESQDILLEKKAIEVLNHYGYHEIITYSFTSPGSSDTMNFPPDDPRRRSIRILNPLSEDLSVLRTSLLPGLLETARYNLSWKNENLRLFECRRIFLLREGEKLAKETKYLAGLALGMATDSGWGSPPRPVDFYDVKGCMEALLEALQIEGTTWNRAEDIPYLHPGQAARIALGGEVLGAFGEVHPEVLSHYDLPGKVFLFEIDFEQILTRARGGKKFQPLPKFPAVYRDLSLVVDETLEAGKIAEAIWNLKQPFIDEVHLFDIYQGAPIPAGKKGVSYRIRYQSGDRTLTDEEVNRYLEQVISRLRETFKAELR